MKGQYNNRILTSKGSFKVRYAFKNDANVTVLVIDTMENLFDGESGDEITFTKEGMALYNAKLPANFKI